MTSQLQAVDVHAHYGLNRDPKYALIGEFMTRPAEAVAERAAGARIALSVVSPLKAFFDPAPDAVLEANEETAEIAARDPRLLQWVVVNPLDARTYEQADRLLKRRGCAGIKIHPELHQYPIVEHGDAVFRFAAEHHAVVTTHSGEQRCMPLDFVPFADAHPEVRLILAHLGFAWDGDPSHQVRAAQASRHGNVFIDTSSAKSIMPGLIEWAVREIGAERLLFGTDSPLYFAPMQRARIDSAEMPDEPKRRILWDNAAALFGLEDLGPVKG